MKYALLCLLLTLHAASGAQPLIQQGDVFPNYILRPVINAPQPQVDVGQLKGKYLVLNFWGTWCAPCIPEMEALAKLQQTYRSRVQIIGVSNDPVEKLRAYLKKRPTTVWLASDTTSNLYRQAGFKFVGQSIVLSPDKKVIALVKTDSLNTKVLDSIIRGQAIWSSAETEWTNGAESGDPFGVDSLTATNTAIRSYMPGKSAMSLTYLNTPLEGRRRTYFNVCATNLYREAYDITSPVQLIYEIDKNKVCNYADRATLLCFDLLVAPAQKDSFKQIMQQKLASLLPYKARLEMRKIPVYVLSLDSSGMKPQLTKSEKSIYSYSGNGFSGTAIAMTIFAQYLSNEAGRPVVDETGLTGNYDIVTKLTLRTQEEVLQSLKSLGLKMEKAERVLPVLIIY